jgi:hypothetical protein
MAANVCATSHSAQPKAAARRPEALRRQRLSYAFAGVATLALTSLAPCIARAQMSGAPGPAPVPGANGGQPLTIGVQERTTYDSDAARSSGQAAELRGLQSGDVIWSPSVTVAYISPNPRRGIGLTGYFGYDYYQKNHGLSREHIDVAASGVETFGRCLVGGQLAYDRGQSGLEDLTLLVTKNTIQTYTVAVNETCISGAGLTESVQVNHSAATNTAATLIDYDTSGVSGSVGFANRAVGNVSLVVNYSKTDYKNPPTPLLGTPNGLSVTGVGVQISRPIGSRLAGTAAVFYSTSHVDLGASATPGQNSSFNGLTANAGLTYRVGPRLQLSADVGRNVSATIRQGAAFAIENRADLAANYTLSSRINIKLDTSWSKETFRGLDTLLVQTAPDRVELWTAGGAVSFKLGRKSALTADVHHEESRTDLALFNFKSDRVSLTISTSF